VFFHASLLIPLTKSRLHNRLQSFRCCAHSKISAPVVRAQSCCPNDRVRNLRQHAYICIHRWSTRVCVYTLRMQAHLICCSHIHSETQAHFAHSNTYMTNTLTRHTPVTRAGHKTRACRASLRCLELNASGRSLRQQNSCQSWYMGCKNNGPESEYEYGLTFNTKFAVYALQARDWLISESHTRTPARVHTNTHALTHTHTHTHTHHHLEMPVDASSCLSIPLLTSSPPPLPRGVSIVLRKVMAAAKGVWKMRRKLKEEKGRATGAVKKRGRWKPISVQQQTVHRVCSNHVSNQQVQVVSFLSYLLCLSMHPMLARKQTMGLTHAHVRTCIPASMRIPAAQSACKRAHTPGTCTSHHFA